MRVLIIEDSRAMRSILTAILNDLDFDVAESINAEQALSLLESDHEFDLALVDWNLPGMSGVELVQVIRANRKLASLPLMMVTTETELGRVREALEAGANEYIMKPFDREMLLEKLALLGLDG